MSGRPECQQFLLCRLAWLLLILHRAVSGIRNAARSIPAPPLSVHGGTVAAQQALAGWASQPVLIKMLLAVLCLLTLAWRTGSDPVQAPSGWPGSAFQLRSGLVTWSAMTLSCSKPKPVQKPGVICYSPIGLASLHSAHTQLLHLERSWLRSLCRGTQPNVHGAFAG